MKSINQYGVLVHYGVPGMKWGVRRYQNYDGTLIGSRPRTGKEKRQDRRIQQLKRGDPTTESVNRLLKKSNSKFARDLVENYEKRKADNIRKAEAKKEKIRAKEDKKYAEKISQNNPIYYKSKTLSDDELRKQISRLKLEKEYRDVAVRDIYDGEHCVKYNKKFEEKTFLEKFSDDSERQLRQELGREFTKEVMKKMAVAAAAGA